MDEHNPDITYATLHQIWVRPSVFRRAAFSRSSLVLNGSRLAVMSHPALATVYDALTGDGSGSSSRAVELPFDFKFFSVNYGNDSTTGGMQLGDNGYITLGYNSTVTSITSASSPGAGLFLGTANRSLLFYGLTPSRTEGGLTYATAVLRFYSIDAGDDEDQVNLEVTFAKNNVTQFIEIRAGSISYDTAGNGTWGLSDGHQFLVNNTVMPALYSGQSMVLQSNSEGRYWVPHVNSSLAIRAPPAPSDGEGAAQRLRPVNSTPSPPSLLLRARWVGGRSVPAPPQQPLRADRPPPHPPHCPVGNLPKSCLELNDTQAVTPLGAPPLDWARPRACSRARADCARKASRRPAPGLLPCSFLAPPRPAALLPSLPADTRTPASVSCKHPQARWAGRPSRSTHPLRST